MTAMLPPLDPDLLRSGRLAGRAELSIPDPDLLALPEKVVQFGTGAFLRGFVDAFIDEANRAGAFGGRIVAVSSTRSGRDRALNDQGGLYTLVMRGTEAGMPRREQRIVTSVSRAISADDWNAVLACARNPDLSLVFSNTTEVGIALDPTDGADAEPPRSFPGKLTRFLLERARAFDFADEKGVVVLPCELVEDNGRRLREIVLELARRWRLPMAFARWLERAVPFCNTLVDRIVPGAPSEDESARLSDALGYRDELLTTCELYRLFAIEGDAALRERLGFASANPGIVVTGDVAPYRERKVRLLNGTHTAMASLALLCGCETVREAVEHELVGAFVRRVLFDELLPTVSAPDAQRFARDVLDRFANPFIRHALIDITLQGTMKMRVRVVPAIVRYAEGFGEPPSALALALAAWLAFMGGALQAERRRAGLPVRADDQGDRVRAHWAAVDRGTVDIASLVRSVCADTELWGVDLSAVPGFVAAAADHLVRVRRAGALAALDSFLSSAMPRLERSA